jgi:hypothetical protein
MLNQRSGQPRRDRARRDGPAIVHLQTGATYRGHAAYDGRTVTIDGRLRVLSLVTGLPTATYRARRRRTVPLRLVREIVWIEDAGVSE